jgi:uncharacterized membrane protein
VSGTRLPWSIFGVIALGALAQSIAAFPQLPDRVASHFGPSGLPNGWMSKPAFFAVYAAMVALAAVVGFIAPRSIQKKSPERINLPNKEYWLAPERRAETFGFFARSFAWYGCAVLLILVLAMGLAIQANFTSPPRMAAGSILAVLGGFIVFNVLWVAQLMRHFSNPR